jgi:hypothetical protein
MSVESLAMPTMLDEICKLSPAVPALMTRLLEVAPPPQDHAGLLAVVLASQRCAETAFNTLQSPNHLAQDLIQGIDALANATVQYRVAQQIDDSSKSLSRRFSSLPVWSVLLEVSKRSDPPQSMLCAVGIAFSLSWIGKKPFARGYAISLRDDEHPFPSIDELIDARYDKDARMAHVWLRHFTEILDVFVATFDQKPGIPRLQKSFEQKAASEYQARAAYPNARLRAAVLNQRTLGQHQIEQVRRHIGNLESNDRLETSTTLWMVGFSGLNAQTVHRIPLTEAMPPDSTDWVVRIHIDLGLMQYSWEFLSHDAAKNHGVIGEPAARQFYVPLPVHCAEFLQTRLKINPDSKTLGDLIPALKTIVPHQSIFPSLAKLAPSFAKWGRSVSTVTSDLGIDRLIGGLLTASPGMFGRAKLYYARVQQREVWQAAAKVYQNFGWSQPVEIPEGEMAFGATVVPNNQVIRDRDALACSNLNLIRPGPRSALDSVICFHNAYTKAFCFRSLIRLTLREFDQFDLSANTLASDRTVDIFEKSAHGRTGGLPAVLTQTHHLEIKCYKHHLASLFKRLQHKATNAACITWLKAAATGGDVPLAQLIDNAGKPIPVRSLDVLGPDGGVPHRFALDVGRKWAENALRERGVATCDIDRVMRHEVLGQENNAALAIQSELDWVIRMRPILEDLHKQLFQSPLFGLVGAV